MRLAVALLWSGLTALAVPAAAQDLPVDLELVLAVDISQSVDAYEGYLQRRGYVEALVDAQVIEAIQSGVHGRIAVTYIEWGGPGIWIPIVDWRVVASADDAYELAETLATERLTRGRGTSISGVLGYAMTLFDGNGFQGERRVIDISGDGPNSSGGIVSFARDNAVAAGITVNGLAINNFDGSMFSLPDLDVYYRECVIGGPGAFVIAADGFESYARAILRKLILEIADAVPATVVRPQVRLVQGVGPGPLFPQQKYGPACDVGERMRLRDNPGLRNPDPPANP